MRLVSPTGTTKNSPMASASATTTVPNHMPPRDLLLLLGQLGVGRDAQGLEADDQRLDQRDDAADDRQAQQRGGA